ncbi:MAG TPA: PspC domain-containing protein [Candidatus Acidoferrum sp.]|nr:PspC domain-containing protein [Candidatus Acidoferrum sp.]
MAAQGVARLYRANSDKKIAGVCGGIGAYLEIDSTLIRLGWIIFTVLTGVVPGVVAYVIAAAVMPREPE